LWWNIVRTTRVNTLLSRRDFLLFTANALLGTLFGRDAAPDEPPPEPTGGEWEFIQPSPAQPYRLGRVTRPSAIREAPSTASALLGSAAPEDIVLIFEEASDPDFSPYHTTWYRIEQGYIFSGFVQVIEPYRMPPIITEMPDDFGFWGQVITPHTIARTAPGGAPVSDRRQPVYNYATVYHIVGIEEHRGEIWYEVVDDMRPQITCWVLARHIRPISEEEFAPINPLEMNKQIIIVLSEQRLYALEGEEIVLRTLCATGREGYETPEDWHRVQWKKPSRHMVGSDFNLPGVPWNTYFQPTDGLAIHGTYWHAIYGAPRSHGCVNVTPEIANWIFRWTTPYPNYRNDFVMTHDLLAATPILVIDYYDVETEGPWPNPSR